MENHWAAYSKTGGDRTAEDLMQFKPFPTCKSAVLPNDPEAGQVNGAEDECCWQLLVSTGGETQTPLWPPVTKSHPGDGGGTRGTCNIQTPLATCLMVLVSLEHEEMSESRR